MSEEEEYEFKLIIRAFNSALFMWGEAHLRENPGLLYLEAEFIRNLDAFTSSSVRKFKPYIPPENKKNALI